MVYTSKDGENGINIVNPNSISLPKQGEKGYAMYENSKISLYNLEKKLLKEKKL